MNPPMKVRLSEYPRWVKWQRQDKGRAWLVILWRSFRYFVRKAKPKRLMRIVVVCPVCLNERRESWAD